MTRAIQGRQRRLAIGGWIAASVVVGVTVWSAVAPADRLTWWLEMAWVIIGLPLAVWVARTRGMTGMLVVLLTLHA
ncbi:MAG: hypothetical protein FJ256_08660, partial [Phycisphaerae bacterium]|nr:hypothetical protein [Phycisphaerae bacterium]